MLLLLRRRLLLPPRLLSQQLLLLRLLASPCPSQWRCLGQAEDGLTDDHAEPSRLFWIGVGGEGGDRIVVSGVVWSFAPWLGTASSK